MKKLLVILSFICFIVSCDDSKKSNSNLLPLLLLGKTSTETVTTASSSSSSSTGTPAVTAPSGSSSGSTADCPVCAICPTIGTINITNTQMGTGLPSTATISNGSNVAYNYNLFFTTDVDIDVTNSSITIQRLDGTLITSLVFTIQNPNTDTTKILRANIAMGGSGNLLAAGKSYIVSAQIKALNGGVVRVAPFQINAI